MHLEIPAFGQQKNPDKIGVYAEHIFFMFLLWRKRWDSNPRAREGYLISSVLLRTHFNGFYPRNEDFA